MSLIYNSLCMHSTDSDMAVIRAAYDKFNETARRDKTLREKRHEVYRICLKAHHEWQQACANMRFWG